VSSSKWTHPTLQSTETQEDFTRAFSFIAEFINVSFNFLGYIQGDSSGFGYQRAYAQGSDLNISFSYDGLNSSGVQVSDGRFTELKQTAYCKFPTLQSDVGDYVGAAGDTWLNWNNSFIRSFTFETGTPGFALLVHELLHGLGLKHPHDSGGTGRPTYTGLNIKYADRQWISIMSYDLAENGGDGAYTGSMPIGPMIFDAIALQYLYGESRFNSGDTIYALERYIGNYYNCQWDYSGIDTLDGTNLSFGVVVDLGMGTAFNGTAEHNIGFITTALDYLTLSISNPSKWTWLWGEYENINGTRFNDILSGNSLNNSLNGGDGDDYLIGGSGNDTFDWNPDLRSGADTMEGGEGNDTYIVDSVFDVVIENSLEGVDTVYVGFNYSLLNTSIENIGAFSGQQQGVTFTGNSWHNQITGSLGADYLIGNEGNDTLVGEAGNDILFGGAGNDVLRGDDGSDTAQYLGSRSSYTITFASLTGAFTVSSATEGSDTVTGTEFFKFSDRTYSAQELQTSGVPTAPTITKVSPLADGKEDTPYVITWTALAAAADEADAQGDPIAFRVESVTGGTLTKSGVSVVAGSTKIAQGEQLTWLPPSNANGVLPAFMVRAVDAALASTNEVQVSIQVVAVNDSPVVATPLPDRAVSLGSSLNFSFGANSFSDVDSSTLTYTASRADGTALPSWLSFTAGTRTFTGTPASADIGTLSVRVTASDGSLATSDTFDVVVSQRPNTAPVAANASGSTSEDTALTASLPAATDGESDTVTYAKATNPVKGTATVTSGGSYTYTPATNYSGPDSFTYTVSDAKGGSNTYTVSLTVSAVNDAPVATGGSLSSTEDTQATGTLLATDVDSASLTYAVVSKPANGSVVLGAGGTYTYTSSSNFNGTDSFTFKANDGSADSNTASVSITVAAVNDAPVVVTPLADRSVTLGSSLNFTFGSTAFTDVETTNLTYSATRADGTALPSWLSFNAGTRTFSGTPGLSDIGTVSVKVTASDGSLSAGDVFDVVVSEPQRAVSGVVQDGYVAGASIFVDRNGNGLPDAVEDTGLKTDSSGNFTGTITGTGNLIAVGGTNVDTGLRNTLTLTAPQGATVISPVTTLVQTLVSTQDLTSAQAQQKVAQAFGIDATTDLLRFDPLASTGAATSPAALTVQKANAQVALTAGLVSNASSVISSLAQVVAQASTPVDLSKATTVAQVTAGLNVSDTLQATIALGNAQVQASMTLSNVAQAQKTTVTTALPSNTDWTAPTVSAFSPADGAASVAVTSNVTLTFSEPVQRGGGTITLRRADGTLVEQFDAATSNRLTVQGNTLALDPSADLTAATGYYLEMPPGSVRDTAGNLFIGSSSYDFSTQSQSGDVSAPTATKWGPADGANSVPVGANLSITYNELIQRGSGTITLKTADGKVVETFTSANSTVSGSTLTLNPTADLSVFTKYVVELGAGAIKDLAGNANAADSRYDFQTATQDSLYHFFVVAFAAAPGASYMGQLAEAVNYGLSVAEIVEIFTTKPQFTSVYPTTMSNRELATQLVNNIVKDSASVATKLAAIDDIDAALGIGWSRGKMLFQVFGNLASKPLADPVWGGTAKQFQNQLAVARYFTEEMGVATETLATLRGVISSVTPDTDVSTVDKIVQIIGTVPPGG
jgi:VCBS repeat-containing protein